MAAIEIEFVCKKPVCEIPDFTCLAGITLPYTVLSNLQSASEVYGSLVQNGTTYKIENGASAYFASDDTVKLNPGFEVEQGGEFTAEIISNPCP